MLFLLLGLGLLFAVGLAAAGVAFVVIVGINLLSFVVLAVVVIVAGNGCGTVDRVVFSNIS